MYYRYGLIYLYLEYKIAQWLSACITATKSAAQLSTILLQDLLHLTPADHKEIIVSSKIAQWQSAQTWVTKFVIQDFVTSSCCGIERLTYIQFFMFKLATYVNEARKMGSECRAETTKRLEIYFWFCTLVKKRNDGLTVW